MNRKGNHPKKIAMGARLPLWHRGILIFSVVGVWGTGVLWLCLHYFGKHDGPFGVEFHGGEMPIRAAHGFIVLVFLIAFGTLVPFHFRAGWMAGTRFRSSLPLIAVTLILILTGWGLYYAGGESLRQGLHFSHSLLGVLLLPLFLIHAWRR